MRATDWDAADPVVLVAGNQEQERAVLEILPTSPEAIVQNSTPVTFSMKYAAPRACGSAQNKGSCFRTILWRLTIRPIVQDRSQSLQIDNRCHVGVLSEALHLFRNVISLSRQPWEPVSGLSPAFLVVEYDIRQPSFHGPPDQPAVTTFAQILILWNPDAKLDQPPIKGRRPNIDAEFGSHLRKPVGRLTITVEVIDSTQPAIARRRRVEGQIFAGRSIDDPASSGKLGMNCAKIMPGWMSPATPLLVPTKKRRGNKWRDCPVADHVSPSIARRPDLTQIASTIGLSARVLQATPSHCSSLYGCPSLRRA